MTALVRSSFSDTHGVENSLPLSLRGTKFTQSDGAAHLIGKTCLHAEQHGEEQISMIFSDGSLAVMYHPQQCCESVTIEDVNGDLSDLIGTPLLVAEERSQDDPDAGESGTWTFYCLRTIKGSIDIRWYGVSNGYYGEEAMIAVREPAVPLTENERSRFASEVAAFRASRGFQDQSDASSIIFN